MEAHCGQLRPGTRLLKLILPIFAAAFAAALLSGCGTVTSKFVYPNNINSLVVIDHKPVYKKRVAVRVFEDARGNESFSGIMLFVLPGCPFGYASYDRPDNGESFPTIDQFNFTPDEDLAKAAAVSLRRSRLFADAFFTYGGEEASADLVFEGRVLSTYFKGRKMTYCFSLYGTILWVVGAPYATSLNHLTLEFRLRKRSGEIIWTHCVDKEDYMTQWIYYRRGQDVKLYAPLMEQAMNESILDLASTLRSNPKLLDSAPNGN